MELANLKKCSGTLDLEAHVKAYMTQAQLFSKDMDMHCRLFPTTLDTNPKMTGNTTSKLQKGQSSQNTKLRLTKHQDNIRRRRS